MAKIKQTSSGPNAEWDGEGDTGEEVATPPVQQPAASTAPVQTGNAEPGKVNGFVLPTLPPHDETVHTKTPTPEETHQDGFEAGDLPEVKVAGSGDNEDVSAFELPDPLPNYYESLKLATKLEQTPVKTKVGARARLNAVEKLRGHAFSSQQGLPAVDMTAAQYGDHVGRHRHILKRERIESVAQSLPEVAELLDEYDKLLKKWNQVPPDVREKIK